LSKILFSVKTWPKSLQVMTHLGILPLHWDSFHPAASADVIRHSITSYVSAGHVHDQPRRLPLHVPGAHGRFCLEMIQCLVQSWPELQDSRGKGNGDGDGSSCKNRWLTTVAYLSCVFPDSRVEFYHGMHPFFHGEG